MTFFSHGLHAHFEEIVYQSFPIDPAPKIQWEKLDRCAAFAEQARPLLAGRKWPEVIGYRLNDGELDLSLSIWMKILPLNIFHYYLPSHLIFASILLKAGPDSLMYPMFVMEAFILPPSTDLAVLEKMEMDTNFESSLAKNAEVRTALYERMSKEQRVCVAKYLSLYLTHRGVEPEDELIYMRSRDIWENSLL